MALLRYTALRVALFIGVAAVLYLVGIHNLLLCAMIAILLSGLISVVALKNVRTQVALSRQADDQAADIDAKDGTGDESTPTDETEIDGAATHTGGAAPKPRAVATKHPRTSLLQRISDRIDEAARSEDEADDAERAALGEPMPPIPRPDLPEWEQHVPRAPSDSGRPEQSR